MSLNEDTLVQQTTAEYLRDQLGWETVHAFHESFGLGGTLGRASDREVVLARYLMQALQKLNPGLPVAAYQEALRQVTDYSTSQSPLQTNQEKYGLLREGVQVAFRDPQGDLVKQRLRLFDFNDPDANHFLCVREFWVRGEVYRRRADLVGFVNGIPLLFIECKALHKNLRYAYDKNFKDYQDTVPHLFHHNAFVVLANGIKAKIGSVSSRYGHFHEWKRLAEDDPGVVHMETLLKGVCNRRNFLDLFENFILFDDSTGKLVKIVGRNHQFLGVNRAVAHLLERKERGGRLGVFWHTQGSGKSYSMVFLTRKVHRKLGGNFTFLICTDREDLDTQIYRTYAGCGVVDNDWDPCRAGSGEHLRQLLGQHKGYVFTLIQKFNQEVAAGAAWSNRDDVIVISDEAHRTQYGRLALNMRDAIPNASYLGFTGTPLFSDDEITRRVFGEYVSTYDFQRAVEDGATVPLYYDARGEKLKIATTDLNERVAAVLEKAQIEGVDEQQRLERELKRDYHILTAEKRLDQVARDLVEHYSTAWESGKAMVVCIDKITCVRVYNLVQKYWAERTNALEAEVAQAEDEQDEILRRLQVEWMRETRAAVVISEEQGEVERFRQWKLDIVPHRKLLKDGFELADGSRVDLESAFKRPEHPFRLVVVCAMWLTGFDVPSLSTLYLDKPLKAHTLMQAIARANRVSEGKGNGLIVDYCGILKNLRRALATFAVGGDGGAGGGAETDPARPEEELLDELREAITLAREFLTERGASLDTVITATGFARNAAILHAKEAANESDETRKTFELMCREVFRKFKACVTLPGVKQFRGEYDALDLLYKMLQEDREKADISDILRQLQAVVDGVIDTQRVREAAETQLYDISKIDFERLRQEFAQSAAKNTTVQNLKDAIQARLKQLLARNPLRTDLQARYEEIVEAYNQEKDRLTIEQTFQLLLQFVEALDEEETRAVREGLDEESLAVFDLLAKPDLTPDEVKRIKGVAAELLQKLKAEQLRVEQWREREQMRSAVRVAIQDFLWSDRTGLPTSYTDEEVKLKVEAVFQHVYYAYPTVPSPIYGAAA